MLMTVTTLNGSCSISGQSKVEVLRLRRTRAEPSRVAGGIVGSGGGGECIILSGTAVQ